MIDYTVQLQIKIDGVWTDFSEFVQLPIMITKTMDETMDRAEVELNFTDIPVEIEAWSDVNLTVSSSISTREYPMLVQGDVVEEINTGPQTSKYRHKLSLIELTHKLTSKIVDDFSITQGLIANNVIPPQNTSPIDQIAQIAKSGTGTSNFWQARKYSDNNQFTIVNNTTVPSAPEFDPNGFSPERRPLYSEILQFYEGTYPGQSSFYGADDTEFHYLRQGVNPFMASEQAKFREKGTAILRKPSITVDSVGYDVGNNPYVLKDDRAWVDGIFGAPGDFIWGAIWWLYTGVYDFNISKPTYNIDTEIVFDSSRTIFIPAPPTPTFRVRQQSLKDDNWGWSAFRNIRFDDNFIEEDYGPFPIATTESIFRVDPATGATIGNDIINLMSNRQLPISALTPGARYRYRISSASNWWDTTVIRSNQYWSSSKPVGSNSLPSLSSAFTSAESFPYSGSGGISASTKLFEWDLYFDVVTLPTADRIVDLKSAVEKALAGSTSRRIYSTKKWTTPTFTVPASFKTVVRPSGSYFFDPDLDLGKAESYDLLDATTGNPNWYRVRNSTLTQQYYTRVTSDIITLSVPAAYLNTTNFDTSPNISLSYATRRKETELDGDISGELSSKVSADLTFAGNKNLLEVLSTIGRQFDGIPRLRYKPSGEGYILSFDILDRLSDNPSIVDESSLISRESSTDNYSTGLVSEVENIILDDEGNKNASLTVYPSSNSFVNPRSSNYSDPLVALQDQVIAIDDDNLGIYQISKVEISNFNPNNTSEILNITDYVLEETIYNSLPNTKDGKGKRLYYRRGDNKIQGVGKIPDDLDGQYFQNTDYRIWNILEELKPGFDGSDSEGTLPPSRYRYRVTYIPIVKKSRLYVEQPNITDENTSVYNTYSQEDRNLSMYQFGVTTERVLERSGLNDVTKTYIVDALEKLPDIGEEIVENGYPHYADQISAQFDNNSIKATVRYSKNFNKIDRLVGYGKDFREYTITIDDIVWKRHNVNTYAYATFSSSMPGLIFPQRTLSVQAQDSKNFARSLLVNSIANTFLGGISVLPIETIVIKPCDIDGTIVTFRRDPGSNVYYEADIVEIPVVQSYSATSSILTASFYDNFSAGRYLTNPGAAFPKQFGQADARYVNDYGKVSVLECTLMQRNLSSLDPQVFPKISVSNVQSTYTLKYTGGTTSLLKENFNVLIDKDTKEAVQLIYQLNFQSKDPEIDVRPAIAKYNSMVKKIGDPYSINIVGVPSLKDIKNRKTLSPTENYLNVLTTPSVLNSLTLLVAGRTVTSSANYEGYAYVHSVTGEIFMVMKRPVTIGLNGLQPIYIHLSDFQV